MTHLNQSRTSNYFIDKVRDTLLRGGRMTKYKGQAASYAPSFTGVLAMALMTSAPMMMTGTGAMAGTCAETALGSGVWTCSGPAAVGGEAGNTLLNTADPIVVNTNTDFGVDSTTGMGVRINRASTAATDITFNGTNTGTISGTTGIHINHNGGSGDVEITTTGDVVGIGGTARGSGSGIWTGSGKGVKITTNGDVTGAVQGIHVNGSGANGGGDTEVYAYGDVTGARFGIYAWAGASFQKIVTTGTVTGTTGRGIHVNQASSGLGIEIDAQGVVQGGTDGIYAKRRIWTTTYNIGAISVTTGAGAISGGTGSGIIALGENPTTTDITITTGTGAVLGGHSGIYARNEGTGATSITATGTVTGTNYDGIYALNLGTSLTVTTDAVMGGDDGIDARNYGTAGLTITVNGDVEGQAGHGINAFNSANDVTASMVINQAAGTTTTGAIDGIHANNLGGSLTINALGTSIGTADDGIDARNAVGTTDLTITAADTMGARNGIRAVNRGTGATSITVTGTAAGTANFGISAQNAGTATDLTIVAVDTMGGHNGIIGWNAGTGATSITSTGTATGAAGYGIEAQNAGTATDLTIVAAETMGGNDGIYARNAGTGATSITATGTTTGTTEDGIFARNFGTSLTVTTDAVMGGDDGIDARNYGTDLTIVAADTIGGYDGIRAVNRGTGATSITATGTTTGTADYGINARNFGTATDLTIVAAETMGGYDGIRAVNAGTGATSITATGTTTGTTEDGIFAVNYGTSLTVTTHAVMGGDDGIDARNYGTAGLTITVNGDVEGQAGHGINAYNSANDVTASMVINQAAGTTTTGAIDGIHANNLGGSLTINALGTSIGKANDGIRARNGPAATNLSITANTVTGNIDGIRATNDGTGATSITTTGVVKGMGTFAFSAGVYGWNRGTNTTTLTIDTNDDVYGARDGINAWNHGTDTNITTAAGTLVNGAAHNGIRVVNYSDATGNITINALGNITGGADGINSLNAADGGATTIITEGIIIGGLNGIGAYNDAKPFFAPIADPNLAANSTDITITTGNMVTGATNGIKAINFGTGATSITTTGMVTGTTEDGIYANSRGTSLTVTTGAVLGGDDGIDARNFGTAGLTISVNGDVEGEADHGINAYNSANDVTASMVINQAAGTTTTGAIDGIHANNLGGSLTINALGTSIGTASDGIHAVNNVAGTTTSTITAYNATGGVNGIYASNNPAGLQSITVTGTVTGGTGYGIATYTGLGGMTDITLDAGAAVSSTAGLGIYNDAGDSVTTVNAGASVAGDIVLSDGSDNLIFAGGDFSGVTLFDGGDDVDTADTFIDVLTFSGSIGALAGATVVNWESVVIDAGSTISFSDNALTVGTLTTNAGGILDASGSALAITGNLTNDGTVTMLDGAAGDMITVSGDYAGTGVLEVDVDFATDTADTLVVGGDVTSGTTLVTVNDISTGDASGNDVLVVDVAGSSVADAFALDGGPVVVGAFNYDLGLNGNDWYLASALLPTTPVYEAYSYVLGGLNTLPTLQQRVDNRYWIKENTAGGDAYVNSHPQDAYPGWVRIEGSLAHVAPASSETGFEYTLGQYKIQAGVDAILSERETGRIVGGINAYYGAAWANISSDLGDGTINATGYGIGATATWYGHDGLYVDAQAQYSWFDSDLTADGTSAIADNKGSGYALSLEAGKRFDYGEYTTFTPQAQLAYSAANFDTFTGPSGEVVALDKAETLKARVGVSIDHERTAIDANGEVTNAHYYGIVNLYHNFGNGSQVDVSGTELASVTDGWSGEIGLGSTHGWVGTGGQDYSVYAEISALTGLTNFGDNNSFKGTLGFKMEF